MNQSLVRYRLVRLILFTTICCLATGLLVLQTNQQMVGFGASLTDSSAWLVSNKMSQSQRSQLMTNLFSPTSGIGLDFLRQPMGASDMALPAGYEGTSAPGEYTYDDMPAGQSDPGLTHFSVAHDTAYIIPLLQQALQLNS